MIHKKNNKHQSNFEVEESSSTCLCYHSKLIGHGYGSDCSYEKPGLKKQSKELTNKLT